MINNPWSELPSLAPFVLPGDREVVEKYNAKPKRKEQHLVRLDILPEPFVGLKNAPVLLLSNNPGYGQRAFLKHEGSFLDRMRANLHHQPSAYPFVYLDPAVSELLHKWWKPRLKHLVKQFGAAVVARSILNVTCFPYASQRFNHGKCLLDSQQYSFRLVREAMERNSVIVMFRTGKRWLEAVEGLREYARLYHVRNVQNPTISPKNCEHFEDVVAAIRNAEESR